MFRKNIHLNKIQSQREFRDSEPAYDVRKIGTDLGGGKYELQGFDDSGVEYFDGQLDRGIWSIGVHRQTGDIIASLQADLYCHPDFECIWLR